MDDLIEAYKSFHFSSKQLDSLLEASGQCNLPDIFKDITLTDDHKLSSQKPTAHDISTINTTSNQIDTTEHDNHPKSSSISTAHHQKDPRKIATNQIASNKQTTEIYLEELSILQAYLNGLTVHFERMHDNLKYKLSQMDVNEIIKEETGRQISHEKTMRSEFYVIAAACRNNGIGIKNNLPWRLKNELAYFNRMTTETKELHLKNVVIMGRKTWSSIPPKYRPLKDRTNVVLSRTVSTIEDRDSVDHIFASLPAALEGVSQLRNKGQVWVIGGQSIYEEALRLPQCKRIYLTRIDADFECDTFFPEVDLTVYAQTNDEQVPEEEQEEGGIKYNFMVYERSDNTAV